MKKIMTMAVAMCLTVTMSAFAHDDKKADKSKEITVTGIVTDPMCAKSGDKAKMSNEDCTKRCAKDGKLSLVNDKDGSVWAIENVDAVKGHEGHHVKVMGHANTEAKSFHITSVSMETGNMGKGDMKHDMHHDKEMKKEKKPAAKTDTSKT